MLDNQHYMSSKAITRNPERGQVTMPGLALPEVTLLEGNDRLLQYRWPQVVLKFLLWYGYFMSQVVNYVKATKA